MIVEDTTNIRSQLNSHCPWVELFGFVLMKGGRGNLGERLYVATFADQVTVAVSIIDARHRRPELVVT